MNNLQFRSLLPGVLLLLAPGIVVAQTLDFTLEGSAGPGLTAANEPADVIDGGSGDIGPNGISVDLETMVLSVDVHWGSGNGYTDLSSDVDSMNLHGPTSQPAPDNYIESAGVLTNLEPFDPSAFNGGFVGTVKLTKENLRELLEGRYYVHLHTFVNPDGEARGYLIPEVVLSDVNIDGVINLLDVAPFVDAVNGTGGFSDEADINRDGENDLLDVQPFVCLISSG